MKVYIIDPETQQRTHNLSPVSPEFRFELIEALRDNRAILLNADDFQLMLDAIEKVNEKGWVKAYVFENEEEAFHHYNRRRLMLH